MEFNDINMIYNGINKPRQHGHVATMTTLNPATALHSVHAMKWIERRKILKSSPSRRSRQSSKYNPPSESTRAWATRESSQSTQACRVKETLKRHSLRTGTVVRHGWSIQGGAESWMLSISRNVISSAPVRLPHRPHVALPARAVVIR